MKKFCNGHPTRKAHWHCPKCNAMFCPECVAARESENFWQKRNSSLLSQMQPAGGLGRRAESHRSVLEPDASNFHLSVFPAAVGPDIGFGGRHFVFFRCRLYQCPHCGGCIWLIVLKYSFESLKATAGGNLKPPPVNGKTISEDIQQVFKQFAIYVLIFSVLVCLR